MTEPPMSVGATQLIVTEESALDTATPVGAAGARAGEIELVTAEAVLRPTRFSACTENVYEAPLVRPVTVHVVAEVEQVNDPGVEVTT